MNRAITTALTGIVTAQFLKVPLNYLENGIWDWTKLFGTGDMPSSHSSAVTSLTTYVALKKGVPSVDFGVSTIFGLIVMYDAMGIRWQTGEIAIAVNDLNEQIDELSFDQSGVYHEKRDRELKEMLGHLPIEVAGGAMLGVAIGVLSYLTETKKTKKASDTSR
nr:divergent PAP2 family protein [Paraliobacillus sediminis]